MGATWTLTPPYFLVLGFLCGVAGFRVGWRTGSRVLLPAIQGLVGWGVFLLSWTIVGPIWAAAAVGAWGVGTTLISVYVFLGRPAEADARVMRAEAYRAAMLSWLSSGRGPESVPGATILQHARELIRYLAAATLTANLVSLAMGAALLNMMNAYVATLLRAATRPAIVVLFAWNVWSVIRVAAHIALGAAAASPLLAVAGGRCDAAGVRALAIAGAAGVAADLVLEIALSRPCGKILARAVDLSAAAEGRSADSPLTLHLS